MLPIWQRLGMVRIHPLTAFRQQRSLTQAELARMLDVYPSTVMRWEAGVRPVGMESLPKIAEVTGIPPAELRPDLADVFKMDAAE